MFWLVTRGPGARLKCKLKVSKVTVLLNDEVLARRTVRDAVAATRRRYGQQVVTGMGQTQKSPAPSIGDLQVKNTALMPLALAAVLGLILTGCSASPPSYEDALQRCEDQQIGDDEDLRPILQSGMDAMFTISDDGKTLDIDTGSQIAHVLMGGTVACVLNSMGAPDPAVESIEMGARQDAGFTEWDGFTLEWRFRNASGLTATLTRD